MPIHFLAENTPVTVRILPDLTDKRTGRVSGSDSGTFATTSRSPISASNQQFSTGSTKMSASKIFICRWLPFVLPQSKFA
jgi:hypothetical protein